MTDEKDVVNEGEGGEGTPEVKLSEDETRAVSLGWKPKEEWQGNPDDWVPAKWWLKYGDVEQRLLSAEQEAKHKEKVLGSMKNHYVRVKEDAIAEIRDTIKRAKKEAMKNEDFARVAELDLEQEVLETNVKQKFAQADEDAKKDVAAQPGPPPEFYEWNRRNSWYTLGSTDELSSEADSLAIAYMQKNPNASYKEMLTTVEGKIKKLFPDKFKGEEPPIMAVDDGGGEHGSKGTKGGTKSPKLSDVEKEVAKRFGMTEAEYAKERDKYSERKGL